MKYNTDMKNKFFALSPNKKYHGFETKTSIISYNLTNQNLKKLQ